MSYKIHIVLFDDEDNVLEEEEIIGLQMFYDDYDKAFQDFRRMTRCDGKGNHRLLDLDYLKKFVQGYYDNNFEDLGAEDRSKLTDLLKSVQQLPS